MPPAKRQMDLGSFFSAAPAAPKRPRASSPSLAAISSTPRPPFSRLTYAASLSKLPKAGSTVSESDLLALECSTLEESWLEHLSTEIRSPYFLSLKAFLWSEGVRGPEVKTAKVFPAAADIYAWSKTPLHRIRVVIIGQDPYHGPNQAHGESIYDIAMELGKAESRGVKGNIANDPPIRTLLLRATRLSHPAIPAQHLQRAHQRVPRLDAAEARLAAQLVRRGGVVAEHEFDGQGWRGGES